MKIKCLSYQDLTILAQNKFLIFASGIFPMYIVKKNMSDATNTTNNNNKCMCNKVNDN